LDRIGLDWSELEWAGVSNGKYVGNEYISKALNVALTLYNGFPHYREKTSKSHRWTN